MIPVRETGDGITFAVVVQPRARRDAIVGQFGDALKLAVTAPPVDGRANEACIKFFARALRVPSSAITIVSGQTSRKKAIRVSGITAAALQNLLQS